MSTLPKLLLDRVAQTPQKVAWRQFRLGVWNESTWNDMHVEAAAIGTGLAALGLGKGDVVAVLAGNSTTAIAAELGAQGIGCVAAVLSSDLAPATVRAILEVTKVKAVVVGDQEQFDKVQAANSTTLRSTVVIDARGFRYIEVAGRPDADTILTIGQLKNRSTGTGEWDTKAATVQGSDPGAILCVINRATKEVEAHRYSHDALTQHAEDLKAAVGASPEDIVSVQTSLADPIEHALSVVGPLAFGLAVNVGQPDLSTQAMRQVQPSLVALNQNWLHDAAVGIERRVAAGKGLKGFAARKGLVTRPLLTTATATPRINNSRIVGVAAAVLAFVFLLLTVSVDDFVRLLVCALIALGAALVTVVTGWSAVSSARRGLGLGRTRAILHDGTLTSESPAQVISLLGTLQVPAVPMSPAAGEVLGRVRSEVLA